MKKSKQTPEQTKWAQIPNPKLCQVFSWSKTKPVLPSRLKCIEAAWLSARGETRRGGIFCSWSHRFHLVWKEFRKRLSRCWVWNLTFNIFTHKFIQDLPPLLTIAGSCRNLSFPISMLYGICPSLWPSGIGVHLWRTLLGSLRGSLGTYALTQTFCLKNLRCKY